MSGLLVGIDLGTTSAKAGVVSLDGRELAHGTVPMPWERVPSGAQIDPRRFPEIALGAASLALDQVPDGPVVAVGITSMAETGALLDGAGEPVAPAIAWHDARGEQEARDLAAALGDEEFTGRTGLALRPLCTIAKYRWLGSPGQRWLNVAEWVVHALGGEQHAEFSLSSRTGWLDIHTRGWWPEALDAAGAPAGLLPTAVPAGTPFGKVTAGPERLLGAVLTVGGHDHHCAAVGVGAVDDGDVFDSSGTAEAFIAPLPPPIAPDEVVRLVGLGVNVGWHAVAGRMALLGAQRAGLALQRFLDLLGLRDARTVDEAAAALTDAGGLGIEGLEHDRAAVTGIGWAPGPAQVWRAAVDAVSRRSAEILSALEEGAGPTRRLVVGGGWARSATVRAAKAAALGPFERPRVVEPGCRGAALLAAVAAGLYTDVGSLPRPASEE
jgi:sugar (pentulose or hexulose) kinase